MRVIPDIKVLKESGFFREVAGTDTANRPIIEKTIKKFGVLFLLLCSMAFASVAVFIGLGPAIIILLSMIAIPMVLGIIAYPEFGIIMVLIMAYFVMFVIRTSIIDFQLGTIMDGTLVLLIFGFFLKQKFSPNWEIYKSTTSILITIWILYNILEVANPSAESRMAWVYTVRTIAFVTIYYYLFIYYIKSIDFIRLIFKIWMILSVFAALYAIKQEYIGFFAFEERDLADPQKALLYFINGVWRKFSIFSDPVAFAYNMVISSIFCLSQILGPAPKKTKYLYGALIVLFMTVMLYSGTRSAYVLVPAAVVLFIFMNLTRKIIVFGLIASFFFLVIINMPTNNATLYRFQTAFKPSDDASYNVRKQNQAKVKPYILTHPFGGGLGASGTWGVRFAPYSFLAQFPPDSGYYRVAVELGPVGLFLFCLLTFIVLRNGINYYYLIKDPELKSYCLGMTLIIFALNIGNYPQEAIVQYPANIFFYLFVAMIEITYKLDKEKQTPGAGALNARSRRLQSKYL